MLPLVAPRLLIVLAAAPAVPLGAQTVDIPLADRPLSSVLSDVYRVGGTNAPAWASFRAVRSVAFDSTGNLYVLDSQGRRVIQLSPTGALVRELGREGQGPGEYRIPRAMAVFRSGRVVIHDLSKRAFIVFERARDSGDDLRIAFTDGEPGRIFPAGGDRLAYAPDIMITNNRRVLLGRYDEPATALPIGMISLGDSRVRTLTRAWLPPEEGRGVPFGRMLLAPQVHWVALHDGSVAVADTTSYRVRVFAADGGSRTINRRLPARRTTASDRQRALADYRAQLIDPSGRPRVAGAMAGGGSGGAPPASMIADIERGIAASTVAEELQIIHGLAADWDGRLWIQRLGPTPGSPGPIDIITPTGDYVGTLPPSAIPDAFGPGGLAAFVEEDANGAPIIAVRRIVVR